jgi:putative hydrolase of the HAD superfamily
VKEVYGKQVFLLSNISTYFASHAHEIPILDEIENRVFSAVCGKVKPNADIYLHLCEKYSIAPQETLFIDDSEKNIVGANAVGINGYLFDGNVEKLRTFLHELFSK